MNDKNSGMSQFEQTMSMRLGAKQVNCIIPTTFYINSNKKIGKNSLN